jgi:hypothetical protein
MKRNILLAVMARVLAKAGSAIAVLIPLGLMLNRITASSWKQRTVRAAIWSTLDTTSFAWIPVNRQVSGK